MREIGIVSIYDKFNMKTDVIELFVGERYEVPFDLFLLWQKYKEVMKDKNFKFIFHHTHPFQDSPALSGKDVIAIKALATFFQETPFDFIVIGVKQTLYVHNLNINNTKKVGVWVENKEFSNNLIWLSQCLG